MPSAATCLWAYEQVEEAILPSTKLVARYKARARDIIPYLRRVVANTHLQVGEDGVEELPPHHDAHTKRIMLPSGKIIHVETPE